jgi:PAS domain S-box-containing protein
MSFGSTLFPLFPFALSLASSIGVGVYCWRRRRDECAAAYALVALSQASWTLGLIFEILSPTLAGKLFWDNFQFIGMAGWAVGLVAFTLTFAGRPARFAWIASCFASLPLIVVVVLAYTDPWHHLVRQRTRLVPTEPFSTLLYDFTPVMWACAVYAFSCLVLLSAILFVRYIRAHRLYRRQVGLVLLGNLIPIVGGFATLTVLIDRPERDLTPLLFAVSNLLVAWGLFRYRLFDVLPVARDAVIEAIDDAIFVLDPHDRVVDLNPAARRLLGERPMGLIGHPAHEVVPGWPRAGHHGRHRAAPEAGAPDRRMTNRGAIELSPDPELLRVEVMQEGNHFAEISSYLLSDPGGEVYGRIVLWRDITLRKRAEGELQMYRQHLEQLVDVRTAELREQIGQRESAEQQFRQAQKMEAVGRMAGGIAHDFNNLLQALNLNLESLAGRLPAVARSEEYADVMLELESAAQLLHHLLLFSRHQVLEPQVLDVNAVVDRCQPLVRQAVGPGVRLETTLEPGVWPVWADAVQLQQVLLNLAINARDAMPEGGTLDIRTRHVTAASGGLVGTQLGPGDYVALDVSDTGHGMDAETQTRIFDPFFTTKEAGKGTGLGLSTAYGIVSQSGGAIDVVSAPGTGATFTIYLPCADAPADLAHTDGMPVAAGGRPDRGATILLAEDEVAIRRAGQRLLERNGFEVLEARDGAEALLRFEEHAGHVHLVITDLAMPVLGGVALVRELRARRHDLPVLLVSGFRELEAEALQFGDSTRFLAKPFLGEELLDAVRRLLDAADGSHRADQLST